MNGSAAAPRKSGCLRVLGCAGLLLLGLLILGIYIWYWWLPKYLADGVEQYTAQQVETWKLPAEEQRQILEPVQRFAAEMRSGSLKPAQVLERVEAEGRSLLNHPALPVLAARGFASLNVERLLTDTALRDAARTVNRFQRAAMAEQVSAADRDWFVQHLIRHDPNAELERRAQVRADLSREEVDAALARMAAIADAAAIPEDEQPIPYKELLDDLLLRLRPLVEAR